MSKGIKIPKLKRWSIELADYKTIKGKNNVLANTTSRLETLNIYKNLLENPKAQVVNNAQEIVTVICATNMQTNLQ